MKAEWSLDEYLAQYVTHCLRHPTAEGLHSRPRPAHVLPRWQQTMLGPSSWVPATHQQEMGLSSLLQALVWSIPVWGVNQLMGDFCLSPLKAQNFVKKVKSSTVLHQEQPPGCRVSVSLEAIIFFVPESVFLLPSSVYHVC